MADLGSEEELTALTTIWRARGLSPSSLEARGDGTLVASDRQLSFAPSLPAEGGPPAAELVLEPLDVGEELGRGGMGVVHVAEQLALRRDVAIKRLAAGASPRAFESLLKEAWVGGHLEHPNVVPVHTLAAHDGSPAMVMKRVEGSRWRDLIRDPSRLSESDRADPLGWHVRVLMTVCDAVSFAHSRGVLHLDLKPDNVMVGAFGEVYVLDWGLAVGHGERAPEWLPPARGLRSIAGTPDYMAPELAMAAGERVGEHTDVYLLGAMLHEVVTGRPPHRGSTLVQRLFAAYRSRPQMYEPDVPEELRGILRRAMSSDLAARFASAGELRAALEAFLSHREADAFVREARERLASLEALLGAERADEVALWGAFGGCRFALREARSGWAEHPDVAAIELALLRRMAGWAMGAGRLDLAEAYLGELSEPSPELEARLSALREEADARAARVVELEHLARDQDLSLGSRFRRNFTLTLGALFIAAYALAGMAERRGWATIGYTEMLVAGAITLAIIGPYAYSRRHLVFGNQANATIWSACITSFVVVQGLWLSGLALELPFQTVLALTPIFYLLTFGAVAMLVSARFIASPLLQVPTVILGALYPEYLYEIIGVGSGVAGGIIGLLWRPSGSEETT